MILVYFKRITYFFLSCFFANSCFSAQWMPKITCTTMSLACTMSTLTVYEIEFAVVVYCYLAYRLFFFFFCSEHLIINNSHILLVIVCYTSLRTP